MNQKTVQTIVEKKFEIKSFRCSFYPMRFKIKLNVLCIFVQKNRMPNGCTLSYKQNCVLTAYKPNRGHNMSSARVNDNANDITSRYDGIQFPFFRSGSKKSQSVNRMRKQMLSQCQKNAHTHAHSKQRQTRAHKYKSFTEVYRAKGVFIA